KKIVHELTRSDTKKSTKPLVSFRMLYFVSLRMLYFVSLRVFASCRFVLVRGRVSAPPNLTRSTLELACGAFGLFVDAFEARDLLFQRLAGLRLKFGRNLESARALLRLRRGRCCGLRFGALRPLVFRRAGRQL